MDKETITISVSSIDSIPSINLDDIITGLGPLDVSQLPELDGNMSGTYNSTYDYTTNYPNINITTSPTSSPSYGAIPGTTYHYVNNNPFTINNGGNIKPSDLKVNGDAEFNGDIKWKGRSLGEMLETIEKRLAILTPDPEKLEHFEALRKAYEHYKMLEKLCELPLKDNDN